MPRSCIAIRHVAFEHPGLLGPLLAGRGYDVTIVDAGVDPVAGVNPTDADLIVVLGGPIGAYEEAAYPFLAEEIALLETRLRARRPTLGICLGAQLMARALGARVYPGPAKEIGWAPVALSAEGRASPLRHLDGIPVLHWHGDTFEMPQGAVNLASTAACANQAFMLGANILGLQFHGEADAGDIERWLIGHAVEIAAAGIDPAALRADSRTHGAALKMFGPKVFADWLDSID